jgi:L-rhamnose-H+ transport protein
MREIGGFGGVALALIAGCITGSVLIPIKRVRNWAWENTWLVYAVCAYSFSPWIVAAFSVPHLSSVYRNAGLHVTVPTFLLGIGWGLAVALAGKAIDLVGFSISTALLYGSSVALGSLGALFLIDRSKLFSIAGLRILGWDMILLVGVWLCAQAGRSREPTSAPNKSRTRLGIVVSLLAGVLSTMFNIVLANGAPIRSQAIALGADPNLASNAIWSLAVSAGSLPSIVWCAHLVTRRSYWHLYRKPDSGVNVALCVVMGILWITGTVLYGMSAARLGRLGPAIGWPAYMSAIIITGNAWGWILGEWDGAPVRAVKLLWAGVAVQVVGIVLLSVAP